MNPQSVARRRRFLSGTAFGWAAALTGSATALGFPASSGAAEIRLASGDFQFQHDGILGTSLDLFVRAPRFADAYECERRVLAEIGRLPRILATRDPGSEISRVAAGARMVSAELPELLALYDHWADRTGGVIAYRFGRVPELWREARGKLPSREELQAALRAPGPWNVDALGKAFILDRAVALARQVAGAGLLNIGGDIRVWGDAVWQIGVVDPREPAENAPSVGRFELREGAVATSGGYARFCEVAGQRFSHVLDPRTGWVAEGATSATVVAPDCVTANALATAACILGPSEGGALATAHGASRYLLLGPTGERIESGMTPTSPQSAAAVDDPPVAGPARPDAWPKDFRVLVNVPLKQPTGGRSKRPYVAVWVEDGQKKVVRTIAFWGTKEKYFSEMGYWWRATSGDEDRLQTVSRATRAPGHYSVIWDGKDDNGRGVDRGRYKICLEVNREHGRHVVEEVEIFCGLETKTAELKETPESEAALVEYGPKRD